LQRILAKRMELERFFTKCEFGDFRFLHSA
jgi:hypothetical protein